MAKKMRLHRPSKAMMLAVNAAIDRKDKEVARLLKEHDLDTAELEQRLLLRDGKHYDLNGSQRRGRRQSARVEHTALKRNPRPLDLNITIDGRTSVAKLYKVIDAAERLKTEAQQELKRRPPEQIEPVKKALAQIELLRKEHEKLQRKIADAEGVLESTG